MTPGADDPMLAAVRADLEALLRRLPPMSLAAADHTADSPAATDPAAARLQAAQAALHLAAALLATADPAALAASGAPALASADPADALAAVTALVAALPQFLADSQPTDQGDAPAGDPAAPDRSPDVATAGVPTTAASAPATDVPAVPQIPAAATPPPRSRRAKAAPTPLVVVFKEGAVHWLGDSTKTWCGRQVPAHGTVTEGGWVSCRVCQRRPSDAPGEQRRTSAQAATKLHLSAERMTALARAGTLGVKVGRSWVFTDTELERYKQQQKASGRPLPTAGPRYRAPRAPRELRPSANQQAGMWLDRVLAAERATEERYQLPFRAPARVATTIHLCGRCNAELLFLIFGDLAQDAAGLAAYGRLLAVLIVQTQLPAFVLGPAAGEVTDDDAPSLLLQVWPTEGEVETTTPRTWDAWLAAHSARHACVVDGAA